MQQNELITLATQLCNAASAHAGRAENDEARHSLVELRDLLKLEIPEEVPAPSESSESS